MLKQSRSLRCFLALVVVGTLLLLTLVPDASADPEIGDLIQYIPTQVTIKKDWIKIEGYFINLNENVRVKNFTDYSMKLYYDGDIVTSADFGDLEQFYVSPLSAKKYTFTITGEHDWKTGKYVCDGLWYTTRSFSYTYTSY